LNEEVKEYDSVRACSMNGEKRNACRVLMGKPEQKETAGKTRT
jgi:hypothetical protein